jgi:hypothetical protein
MNGPCTYCKRIDRPGIVLKTEAMGDNGVSYTRRTRYCVDCAVELAILHPDELSLFYAAVEEKREEDRRLYSSFVGYIP